MISENRDSSVGIVTTWVSFPAGTRDYLLHCIQMDPGAHLVSCITGEGRLFPWWKGGQGWTEQTVYLHPVVKNT
jgi:hypothetical protein